MKRLAAALLALTILFAGCARKISLPGPDYTLTVAETEFTERRIHVRLQYPAVSDYADPAAQETCNALIVQKAMNMYRRIGLSAPEDGEIVYSVTDVTVTLAARGFFSAVIAVTVESGGEKELYAYTVNCDLEGERLLAGADIVADFEKFRRAFVGGSYATDIGREDILRETLPADLLMPYKTEYGIYPDFYFREGKICVLTGVVPLLGGYAGFSADIRGAGYLNTADETVAMLAGKK